MSDKNMELLEKGRKLIPGLTQLLSKRPDQFSLNLWPTYFAKAEGSYVWDLNDRRWLDMSIGGIGANVLGYADPDVNAAVIDAVQKGSSSSLNCPEDVELAELFCQLHPWAEMVRYTRSGGEAMAVAIRIARMSSGKDKVAFCGYHGWHDWYLAANLGESTALDGHLLPGLNPHGVPRALAGTAFPFTYNDASSLEALLSERPEIGVVVLEPMRNKAPDPNFLSKVKQVAKSHGCVLVFDEISSGFRVNAGGVHLKLGVEPDIAVFSKAIGNGFPIAVIIGTRAVMEESQRSFISSTNWTERTGPAAALATVKKFMTNNVGDRLCKSGDLIKKAWETAAGASGLKIEVSGALPPLMHFSFADEPAGSKAYFIQTMMEYDILATNGYYAMYSHSDEQIELYTKAVADAFMKVREAQQVGDITARLRGAPSASGFARLT